MNPVWIIQKKRDREELSSEEIGAFVEALIAAWPSPEARLRRVRSLYSARVGQELSRA